MASIKKFIIVLSLISVGNTYCGDKSRAEHWADVKRARKNLRKKTNRYTKKIKDDSPDQDQYWKTVIKPAQKAVVDAQMAPVKQAAAKKIATIQKEIDADKKSCFSRLCCCFSRRK
jgi:hypothetical protein